jgi:26S proteasome regulatory subunit N12
VLESATLLSIAGEDLAAFQRSVAQLKPYYAGPASPSPLHYPILGTRLLQLLVENRMAEFHNEVSARRRLHRRDVCLSDACGLWTMCY